MIKKAGNEFSGATAGRHDRSTWVVRLVNFGRKVHDRSAWCGGDGSWQFKEDRQRR